MSQVRRDYTGPRIARLPHTHPTSRPARPVWAFRPTKVAYFFTSAAIRSSTAALARSTWPALSMSPMTLSVRVLTWFVGPGRYSHNPRRWRPCRTKNTSLQYQQWKTLWMGKNRRNGLRNDNRCMNKLNRLREKAGTREESKARGPDAGTTTAAWPNGRRVWACVPERSSLVGTGGVFPPNTADPGETTAAARGARSWASPSRHPQCRSSITHYSSQASIQI